MTVEARAGVRVSTATRYLANPQVRQAMGIASPVTSSQVEITKDEATFGEVLRDFFEGVRSGKLHSRSVTTDWLAYASELRTAFADVKDASSPALVTGVKPIAAGSRSPTRTAKAKIVAPDTSCIQLSTALAAELNSLQSVKLLSLYRSLTSLRLDDHPALLTTGAWAFFEALTALHGRSAGTEFHSYVNGNLVALGIGKERARDCRLSLEYISQHGNAEKHSATFTAVDARNLYIHFAVLEDVLIALVRDCIKKRGAL